MLREEDGVLSGISIFRLARKYGMVEYDQSVIVQLVKVTLGVTLF